MDGKGFDEITRRLTTDASRRSVFGGLLGGAAALLTGATALEAKRGGKGRGKGKGKGKGKGNGEQKVTICHETAPGKFEILTLGAPGAQAHLMQHPGDTPYVNCCPDTVNTTCPPAEECFTASCNEGTCATTPDSLGTPCTATGGVSGECDGAGVCNPI